METDPNWGETEAEHKRAVIAANGVCSFPFPATAAATAAAILPRPSPPPPPLPPPFSGATTLPLMRVPQVQEMARNRRAGVSGTDRPLTRSQELAAQRRRSTR